jgi:type 1 glutamine amidotransferase
MTTRRSRWLALACGLLAGVPIAWGNGARTVAAENAGTSILIVAGPCQHPPGTHEAAAGARLLGHCLEHAQGIAPVRADVFDSWPKDEATRNGAATVVFIGDRFPGETLPEPEKVKADLAAMMDRGCGIVCIHYATGLTAQHVAADGDHPLLRWLGGYFATGCKHHQSVARVCTATLVPAGVDHPVLRGWQAFTFDDEPYWNNYFGPNGPAANVTSLVTAMLPPESPKKEIVAWAVERPDGGRGVGIVVPHFYHNWKLDDLRTLVLNAVAWTAKIEIPSEGVKSPVPDLAAFKPVSVEPLPPPKTK